MNLSIFDVVGPVMIGPSSSHTAGAARLARVARSIADGSFSHVSFGLAGSFAQTCKGHGTDRALVAGALGLAPDDERLADAFQLAEQAGLSYEFYEVELEGMHENSAVIRFTMENGTTTEVIGSSIGGGRILVAEINGFETEFSAQYSTLIVRHNDQKGIISEVTGLLAEHDINIGVMKLSRKTRGGDACAIIEVDGSIPADVATALENAKGIKAVQVLNVEEEG